MGHYVGSEIIVSAVDYILHYRRMEGAVSVSRHHPEIYSVGLKKTVERLSVGPVTRPIIKPANVPKQKL